MNQRIPNIPIDNKKRNCLTFYKYCKHSKHILLIVLYAFPEVLTRRICLTVKSLDFQMVTIPFIPSDLLVNIKKKRLKLIQIFTP